MAIKKKLIHFNSFDDFNAKKLSANEENTQYTLGVEGEVTEGAPDVLYQSIVFIKSTKQIWTHGVIYMEGSEPTDISSDTPSDDTQPEVSNIILRNADAIEEICASKKYFKNYDYSQGRENHCNLFCIAHTSDMHGDVTRYKNFRDFVDGVDQIDAAIHTGDFVDYPTAQEFEAMNVVTFEKTMLHCVGNHDKQTGSYSLTQSALYEKYNMNTNTGKTYYYKDFVKSNYKIRVIVLDLYDSSLTSSNASKDYCMTQEQITFLVDSLKSAASGGFSVMIAMHTSDKNGIPSSNDKKFYQRFSKWASGEGLGTNNVSVQVVENIVDAFKKGTTYTDSVTFSLNSTTATINADFTQSGSFICYLVGHKHADFIGFSQTHADQLYCFVTCGGLQSHTGTLIGDEVCDIPRISGTKSEDAFNVYSVDTEKKELRVIRVGSRMTYDFIERKCEVYQYEPTNS